jgi:hypothetical protein
MVIDLFNFYFRIDTGMLAGIALWALALYLAFSPLSHWITDQLQRWLNFAEQFYTSGEELERNREAREATNTISASLLSIIPFLIIGGLCNYGVAVGLGRSWAFSVGLLVCIAGGVYELGRRSE